MAMVIAILAAVFLWGVAYKVGLYPMKGQALSRVPAAKLLSEGERPASYRAAHTPRTWFASAAVFTLLLFVAVRLRERRAAVRFRPAPSPRPDRGVRCSAFPHFSFRPPPIALA